MSSHVYHEIYLHFNWHVKDDHPTLINDVEATVHEVLKDRCRKTKGVSFHGVNRTPNHVHLAVNIEPFVTISDLVRDLKGGSSFDSNQRLGKKLLEWQRGYGVVSFGFRNLPWVLNYIRDQKSHHGVGRIVDRLERDQDYQEVESPSLDAAGGIEKPG